MIVFLFIAIFCIALFIILSVIFSSPTRKVLVVIQNESDVSLTEQFLSGIDPSLYEIYATGIDDPGDALDEKLGGAEEHGIFYTSILNMGKAIATSDQSGWYIINTSKNAMDHTSEEYSLFIPEDDTNTHATCGSTGTYTASPPSGDYDLIDIELYSLATVANTYGKDFTCYKFVVDSLAEDASVDA